MRQALLAAGAALLLAAGPAAAQQKSVKIGFVSTFSGPTAVIGNDMRNSFELALDHIGRKMGGLPVEVIYEDDGLKPEVGKQKTEKLIESDKVDFIVGYIWSNVLLASLKPVVDSKTFLIIANAGPSQIAGELCSPYVFSTSWQNDQTPQAMGHYMNQKGVKIGLPDRPELRRRQGHAGRRRLDLQGQGRRAGTDHLAGAARLLRRARQGEGRQARCDLRVLSGQGRRAIPEAVRAGRPQGHRSRSTPPSPSTRLSLPLQKDLALGVPGAQQWVNDLPNDANKKFVADYQQEIHGTRPSFYGAQTYDAAMLINWRWSRPRAT